MLVLRGSADSGDAASLGQAHETGSRVDMLSLFIGVLKQ